MRLANDFRTILRETIENWDGPKLAIAMAGVGSGLARLLDIPGSSKVVANVHCFNEQSQTAQFIRSGARSPVGFLGKVADHVDNGGSTVNDTVARALSRAVEIEHGRQNVEEICIGISGAITTNRYRRGENRVYFTILREGVLEGWYIRLPKLDEDDWNSVNQLGQIESLRILESEAIACIILAVITNDNELMPDFDFGENVIIGPSTPDDQEVLNPTPDATPQAPASTSSQSKGSDNGNDSSWADAIDVILTSCYNKGDTFTLQDFYRDYESKLASQFPNNHTLQSTIRRRLHDSVGRGSLTYLGSATFQVEISKNTVGSN